MKIFGAGLAGLLAACAFQDAEIYEAQPKYKSHKALMRFRTSAVGDLVGVEFKKVRVHKAIWVKDRYVEPTPRWANLYSKKVIGTLAERSIWNIDPCDRYIAPENFIDELIARCGDRIHWETSVDASMIGNNDDPAISTIPMHIIHKWVYKKKVDFTFKQIVIQRFRIPKAEVFQTIYFPSPDISLYRASITGDLLIAEYINACDGYNFFPAFGLSQRECGAMEFSTKQYGKINAIDETWRKHVIFDLTTNCNVYSLGRYATWRNILLDDVVKDIVQIKKLMKLGAYDRAKLNT